MTLSNYFTLPSQKTNKQKIHPTRRIIWLSTRVVRMAESETAENQIMVLSELQKILFCLMTLDRVFFYEILVVFSNLSHIPKLFQSKKKKREDQNPNPNKYQKNKLTPKNPDHETKATEAICLCCWLKCTTLHS